MRSLAELDGARAFWLRLSTSAAARQLRSIKALIVRELLTRYGRKNLGFAWLFIEPMMFTLAIAGLWSLVGNHTAPGLSIVAFAVTGYSSVLVWRNSANRCTSAVATNWALLYHRGVTPLDIYLARIAIEIGGASISLLTLSTLFFVLGFMPPPADLFRVLAAWILLCGFAVAFGLLIGAASALSEVFERFWHVLAYVLFPLSGAVTMVHWLPPAAQKAVLLLPMVHGVEMLRGGWFGGAVQTYEKPTYLLTADLCIGVAALWLIRVRGRHIEPH